MKKLNNVILTHLCLASYKWDIDKQYRPRSDATERDAWLGSTVFALSTGISVKEGNNKTNQTSFYIQ